MALPVIVWVRLCSSFRNCSFFSCERVVDIKAPRGLLRGKHARGQCSEMAPVSWLCSTQPFPRIVEQFRARGDSDNCDDGNGKTTTRTVTMSGARHCSRCLTYILPHFLVQQVLLLFPFHRRENCMCRMGKSLVQLGSAGTGLRPWRSSGARGRMNTSYVQNTETGD